MSDVHLTYSNTMNGGASWAETFATLKRHVPAVRSKLDMGDSFGVALNVSAAALSTVVREPAFDEFRQWLDDHTLHVFTMNAAYGDFDGSPLKDRLFSPDWQSGSRLNYTAGLAQLLGKLLDEDVSGTISTVPLSYKPWLTTPEEIDTACWNSAANLVRLARYLWHIEVTSGRHIQLAIEPGPDGLLETSDDVVRYFHTFLLPIASSILRRQHSAKQIEHIIRRHIGVCFDIAHSSAQFNSPSREMKTLSAAGVSIAKVQATSALSISWGGAPREQVCAQLRELIDGMYLHPTRERHTNGNVVGFRDLEDALQAGPGHSDVEWRVLFPVPVFANSYAGMQSTHDDTRDALAYCRDRELCDQFEIETCTWSTLARFRAMDMDESILRELQWALPILKPTQPGGVSWNALGGARPAAAHAVRSTRSA